MNIGNNMKINKFSLDSIGNEIGNYASVHGNSFNSQFQNFPSFQNNQLQNFAMPNLNMGIPNTNNGYESIPYSGLPLAERQDLDHEGTQNFPPDEDQNLEAPVMMDRDQFDQLDDILDEQSSDQSIPQQRQPKPQVERDIYDQQNQLCQQNNTKLDLWLDEQQIFIPEQQKQKDHIKNQIKVDHLFSKYLIHLNKKQRQQLYRIVEGGQNSKQSGLIGSESKIQVIVEKQQKQNKYAIHRNFKYPKIQVLASEIGVRKYLVYIGAEVIPITACVLAINIVQLKPLIQKSPISLISAIKSLLAIQNKKFKFKGTYGNHAQHLLQTITQIAINKASLLLSNQKNNKLIQSYFGYDFVIFNNCTLFEVNKAQRKNKQNEQKQEDQEQLKYQQLKKQKILTKQQKQQLTNKSTKLIRFIKLLKVVLQFKKLVMNGSLLKIQQQLMAYSKTEICIILVSILQAHATYLESVNSLSQQAVKLKGILTNIAIPQIKLDQIHNILLKSVNFSDLLNKYTEYIETLNKFTISSQNQCLQVIFILLKNIQAKSGFVHRFARSATLTLKQKQEKSQPILLKIRNIMLYFYTQTKNLTATLLQNLHEYFSAIGDQQTALKIQQTLLIRSKPTINYILTLFSFFLQKKINTINYQFFLHNKYIKILQQYKIQKQIVEINGNIEKIQLLNKLKDICLNIMYEIRSAVYKRQFQNFKISKMEIQFRNLGDLLRQKFGNQWNQRGYQDVLLILDHIYNKNYLKLNKKVQSSLTSKVFRAEQSQYVERSISTSYLRIPLLKSYFYHIVYNSQLNDSAQLKRFLQILPPLYRYHSIYFAALCQISGFFQNSEAIFKSNYLKLLNESESSYSCDLVIIIQLLLKNHTQVYEHNKFKLQLNIRSLIKYLKNVDSIYEADNQEETVCLLRLTCQLCYSITRDNILQLQKMRQKLCELLVKKFKHILNENKMIIPPKPEKKKKKNKEQANEQNKVQQKNKVQQNKVEQNIIQQNKNKQNRILLSSQPKQQKSQNVGLSEADLKLKAKKNLFKFQQHAPRIQYHIPQDKKQVFLHSNLLQLILKLSTSQKTRKKQCIDILKILLTKYPQKFTLYYYFLRIKYGIKLGEKKQIRDIMFDNLLDIIKAKNIKAFTNFVESQIFMNQLMEILYGELKEKSLDFITDMAQYVVDVGRSIHSNLISQHIFKFYEHFLNENQTPQEQSYCCYRKITEILLGRLQINFDASQLPNRVLNLSVIRKNFFLSYPLFQAINFKKVCLPDHRKDPYVLKIINHGLSLYTHSRESQVLNKCRAKLYQHTRQYLINKQRNEFDDNEKNKIQRKIRILYKKQYFNNGQHGNWVDQMVEKLSKLQTQKVQNFRQILEKQKSDKIKNKIKQHIFKQEKSQKYIRKIFARMRIKIKKIVSNFNLENQKKQPKN